MRDEGGLLGAVSGRADAVRDVDPTLAREPLGKSRLNARDGTSCLLQATTRGLTVRCALSGVVQILHSRAARGWQCAPGP